MATELGRRDRKKLHTRKHLHRAALELFAEQGFEETTVEQITDVVDVSQRTLFRHFGNKIDVLVADYPQRIARLDEILTDRPADEPLLDAIREVLEFLCADANEQRDVVLVQTEVATREPQLQPFLFAHHLEVGWRIRDFVSERLGDRDRHLVIANAVAAAAFGAHDAVLRQWLFDGAPGTLVVPIDEILALVAEVIPSVA